MKAMRRGAELRWVEIVALQLIADFIHRTQWSVIDGHTTRVSVSFAPEASALETLLTN